MDKSQPTQLDMKQIIYDEAISWKQNNPNF